MTEMVERVARAMYAKYIEGIERDCRTWEDLRTELVERSTACRLFWITEARAAIAAMRGPGLDVLAAGHAAMFQEPWDATTAPMIGAGFDAMIDEALK